MTFKVITHNTLRYGDVIYLFGIDIGTLHTDISLECTHVFKAWVLEIDLFNKYKLHFRTKWYRVKI